MDMVKFVQDGIKQANKNQKTLQSIVDILFDGTVDEILSYSGYEIVSNTDLDNSRTFKVAEGIYGFGTMVYEFTDSKPGDNPLEPFYEYIPD